MNIIIDIFIFWIIIIITIVAHEAAHLISALLFKVPVKTFSIGLGKPIIFKKKLFGITWQITPWLVGGFTDLAGGETKKDKNGFLSQKWSRKAIILLSGVTVNFLLACLVYICVYKSIWTGICFDFFAIKCCLTKNYDIIGKIIIELNLNIHLLQFSMINLFCAITNILPFPALDGGYIWLTLTEKLFYKSEDYEKFLNIVIKLGFYVLLVLQTWLIYYLWFKN